jgi:peptidoglycan/xylan/chitin deacetylase (PgdA/CDA1 family)
VTRSRVCSFIAAIIIAAAAQANPGLPSARSGDEALSHLSAHRPGLPPEALLVPLGNGLDGVLKGHTPAAESRLMDALARRRLNQSVLRVASAGVDGRRMGLIKLQAGRRNGEFALMDLREDAAACLDAAFHDGLAFDQLDLWSVVPGAGLVGALQEHHPIFSLSVSRAEYLNASAGMGSGPEVLDALEGVRYSPVFARYASDCDCVPSLPAGAFTDPPALESWDALLAEARSGQVILEMATQTTVEAIFSGRPDQNFVALTIDDGPHPLITPLMLEILAQKGVRATFFVVGQQVEQFPGLALATVRGGHELANHSYSNRRMSQLPDDEAWAEIASCARIVERVTGEQMRWFRPPGGRCSEGGLRAMASLGYGGAFWSRNTGDWVQPPAAQIVRNATEGLQPGDVILMHQGEMCSVEALPLMIDRIREMGLEPTTLSALGENGGTVRDDPALVSALVNSQISGE